MSRTSLPGFLQQHGGGGGGGATYIEEDFTLTSTGTLDTNNLAVDELGNGWLASPAATQWRYFPDNTGVWYNSTGANGYAVVETSGREDIQITAEIDIVRGAADPRWQGVHLRCVSDTDRMVVAFYGAGSDPNLILNDGNQEGGTLLKTWDLSALLTTPPVDTDTVVLTLRCEGNDITFYSIQVNGGTVETPDDTYTLTGTPATEHGAGSGADWYGLASSERVASSSERFLNVKVESIPA